MLQLGWLLASGSVGSLIGQIPLLHDTNSEMNMQHALMEMLHGRVAAVLALEAAAAAQDLAAAAAAQWWRACTWQRRQPGPRGGESDADREAALAHRFHPIWFAGNAGEHSGGEHSVARCEAFAFWFVACCPLA